MSRSTRNSAGPSKLIAQKSEFSSSVTLFTLDDIPVKEEEPDTLRRSKRIKLEPGQVKLEIIPDLEDLKLDTVTTPRRSLRRTKPEPSISNDLSPLSSAPSSPEPTRKTKGKARAQVKAELDFSPAASRSTSPTKKKSQKPIPQALAKPHPAPDNWKEVYDSIKKMRESIVAPVDTMGCAQAQYKETDPKNQRFATLVSLMLSSQTKDEVTDAAVTKLRTALGGAISVEGIINAPSSLISEAIAKVGFWRRKTDYLKQTAAKLQEEFEGDVPKTVDELCSLPGVGPKMAFLCLQVAWNLNLGIGVDVHVHRISNRLGWHRKPTKDPEETRLNLQSWLPSELHQEINPLLVGFGQVVCTPVNPKCDQCTLSGSSTSKALCPSARKNIAEQKRKTSTKRKLTATSILKEEEDVKPELKLVKVELEIDEEETNKSITKNMVSKAEEGLVKTEQS
ncbi:DNA-(apurinic or apyrimidinic site) lyase [Coprinopsis cinerea okayama7|uniref:Endonuclease III homolog n=1 Tax=Coprinopsis cinerea (strain Okayama-7 / 130 / ATCC MYA-4618 / FGSC 9003) TaxID=240176 RepID=A8NH38_COPC7|nr:DNA-(apurinic or apyrimidinic site) lyase [Coprinopsis cinerea okayama7\|eukprot:XP_001833672.1 DNA-(apurinic or apyrimidinic site) lyase [Coprinopsis cinerea okayama7\